MSDLGKQVRIYRAAHALTQAKLARRLKISASALSLLENGKPTPQLSEDQLRKIAQQTANAA